MLSDEFKKLIIHHSREARIIHPFLRST